jgi:hypothetical protein
LDYPDIDSALDDAQFLSMESDWPWADVILWWDFAGQVICLGLVPRSDPCVGLAPVMRFRDGVGVEGPVQ